METFYMEEKRKITILVRNKNKFKYHEDPTSDGFYLKWKDHVIKRPIILARNFRKKW